MCSLRFSKLRGLVARLTAPPSSTLHLRPGTGLRGCPPPPALHPHPPRGPVCSLLVAPRKDSRGPGEPAPGALPRRPGLSRPAPTPREVPGSVCTRSFLGPLVSPQRSWGLLLPPDASVDPLPSLLLFGPFRNLNLPHPPLFLFLCLPPPDGCFWSCLGWKQLLPARKWPHPNPGAFPAAQRTWLHHPPSPGLSCPHSA